MKNFQIKTILIPIDFSETAMLAIDHAANMAQLFNANIILLLVLEKNFESFNIIEPTLVIEPPTDFEEKIAKKLEDLSENIRKEYGVSTTSICTRGNIFNIILEISQTSNADLIVMGTHGSSGFEEFFIGSNAYKVVTQSQCPVLTIQTNAQNIGFKTILLPIDNSFHSRQKVNHAVELARKYNSTICIAGVLDTDSVKDLKKLEILLDQVQARLEKENIQFTRKTLTGSNIAALTFEEAKKINADLIMVTTDQQADTGLFLGPYVQQIVNHSKIPVMSIRPLEGQFESPSLGGGYSAY